MEDSFKNFNIEKLSDQFTGTTRAVRRNLLIVSAIAIALSVDGIKFGTLFGIDLKDVTSSNLAIGAIALIALYEFVSFLIYAAIDHRSWALKANSTLHKFSAEVLNKISSHTKETMEQLGYIRGKMSSDSDSVVNAIKSQAGVIDKIVDNANGEVERYAQEVENLKRQMSIVNYAQLGRIYILDWGVPIFMGSLCFYRNSGSIWSFISAVFP